MRRKARMTQEELAQKIGVTPMSIYFWEKGTNNPKISHLKAMCELFGCTFDDLLKEDD